MALMVLHSVEYVALVGSFLLVGLEAIIRVLTLALRTNALLQAVAFMPANPNLQLRRSFRSSIEPPVVCLIDSRRRRINAQSRAESVRGPAAVSSLRSN